MNFRLTKQFERKAGKLSRKNPQVRVDLTKQFSQLALNPYHPSLRLHKLQGQRQTEYAIWIRGDLRAISVKVEGIYVFFDLVTHDEY